MSDCILYNRQCIKCNECSLCEYDDKKICDNCCKCIDSGSAKYKSVLIDEIILDERQEESCNCDDDCGCGHKHK